MVKEPIERVASAICEIHELLDANDMPESKQLDAIWEIVSREIDIAHHLIQVLQPDPGQSELQQSNAPNGD